MMLNYSMWITLPQTQNLFNLAPCFCIFEDNQAVIKMIFRAKVRQWDTCPEPTELRLIGCLTESMWTQKIQVKHVDTKNHFADMLTKGNFTRDEWNDLLRLFNIMSFSMFSSSHFSPINNPQTMSKRLMQEGNPGEEKRAVAKSKPMRSLVSKTVGQSPIALGSSVPYSPGTLKAQCSNPVRGPVARGLNENTASSVAFRCKFERQYGETRGGNDKESHWYKILLPQLEDIHEQCSPSWKSLLECTTKAWSYWRRRNTCHWHQRDDLGWFGTLSRESSWISTITKSLEEKIEWFTKSHGYRELDCTDREPVEFEWNIFPTMEVNRIQSEQFEDRIIFMSMYNGIDWEKPDTKKLVFWILWRLRRTQKDSLKDISWSLLGPGREERWYGTHAYKPNGLVNRSADMMIHSGKPGDAGGRQSVPTPISATAGRQAPVEHDDTRYAGMVEAASQPQRLASTAPAARTDRPSPMIGEAIEKVRR